MGIEIIKRVTCDRCGASVSEDLIKYKTENTRFLCAKCGELFLDWVKNFDKPFKTHTEQIRLESFKYNITEE